MDESAKSLEFANLPLVEAAVRVYLNSPMKIDFRLISDLHERLRQVFPNVLPPSTFDVSPAVSEGRMSFRPGELAGAEYAGDELGRSFHLQQQLVAVKWRRAISEHGPGYPRYAKLRSVLEQALDRLQELLAPGDIQPTITNMTYVNFVRVEDPRPYVRNTYWPEAAARASRIQEQIVAWGTPSGVDLRYEIRGAEASVGAEKQPGYLLTTAAGSRLQASEEILHKLDGVHQELQTLFAAMISDRAKQEWGLSNGPSA